MNTYTYAPIPDKTTVPISEWRKFVDDSIARHGVRWLPARYVGDNPDFPKTRRKSNAPEVTKYDPAEPKRKRNRIKRYFWYVVFDCHRSGKYRDKAAEGIRVRGGSSGVIRGHQKPSKKTQCTAKLKVSCLKSDPNNVEIAHTGNHNHDIGGVEDVMHLPLSKERKNHIMNQLRQGYSKKQCRIEIKRELERYLEENGTHPENSLIHRDQMIRKDEIYNLFKKVEKTLHKELTKENNLTNARVN